MENTNKTAESSAKKMTTREEVADNWRDCYVVGASRKTKALLLEAFDVGLTVYMKTGDENPVNRTSTKLGCGKYFRVSQITNETFVCGRDTLGSNVWLCDDCMEAGN